MREELIEVGERVWVELDADGEYNLPQFSVIRKEAIVIGFGLFYCGRVNQSLPPGVYRNRSKVEVCFENGRQCFVGSECIYPIDRESYVRRIDSLRQDRRNFEEKAADDFLCDLPDTLFWEGDLVRLKGGYLGQNGFEPEREIFVVDRIYYGPIDGAQSDKIWPVYFISSVYEELRKTVGENDLELIERGRVWKFHHKDLIIFSSMEERIEFLRSIGQTQPVRNPRDNSPDWQREDLILAMESGAVHNFRVICGPLDESDRLLAERFLDEDFGRIVAKKRMALFGIS